MRVLTVFLLLISSCVLDRRSTPDAGESDPTPPLVDLPGDLDGNGVLDISECEGFDPTVCEIRCPICLPGTRFPCAEQGPCPENDHRAFCVANEDAGLGPPTLPPSDANIVAVGLQIPLEDAQRCAQGFLWTAVATYFGVGLTQLRVTLDGTLVYDGPFRRTASLPDDDGSVATPFGRAIEAEVCLSLAPDDPSVGQLRMAAQLTTDSGDVSMSQCGRVFATLDGA